MVRRSAWGVWVALALLLGAPVRAQPCGGQWLPGQALFGFNWDVAALVMWDADGAGPQMPVLGAGGGFAKAGGVPANYIARWDGASWAPLGSGMNARVYALAVMPNGDLVAGGIFWMA